jgi:hypothetical protein
VQRVAIAGCVLATVACRNVHPPPVAKATLGGAIAQVGGLPIDSTLVAAVARDRGLPAPDALDALVEDALLAQGARERHLDERPDTRRALQASLAARLVTAMETEARERGPASAAERSALEVVHAVVIRKPGVPWEVTIGLAKALEAAVQGAPSTETFEERAQKLPHPGLRVAVERIGPFGADGRLPDGTALDRAFVAAAFALERPGDESPIVATRFGWHVIRLIARSAATDAGAGAAELSPAVMELRVRGTLQSVLRAGREKNRVELEGAVDELLEAARLPVAFDPDAPVTGAAPP